VNYLLHKVQLHVSALDNGHLQVVHEMLSKQLYETYYGLYTVEVGTRSRMFLEAGRCGYMGMLPFSVISMLIQLLYYACGNSMYTYDYPNIYIQCAILYKMWFLQYSWFSNLFNLLLC